MTPKEINYSNLSKIHKILSPFVNITPLIKNSSYLNNLFNTNLFLKFEFFQYSGTFKVRGAINNILNLNDEQKKIGITAVSAGNHAIAASYAANLFGINNKIFMYESANKYRLNKVKSLGANVFLTNPHNAFNEVERASKEDGLYFVHPFDGQLTIQGTGSLGYEICEQMDKIDNVIVSVGGGGLISGVGSAIRQKYPHCQIIGVEPEGAKGMTESLSNNQPLSKVRTNSIADSLCAPLHMPYSFSICKNIINQMVTVTDDQLKNSMRFMYDQYKLALEPACVAGIAALLGPLKNKFLNENTLIILCGSNIDMKSWLDLTREQ